MEKIAIQAVVGAPGVLDLLGGDKFDARGLHQLHLALPVLKTALEPQASAGRLGKTS